MTGYSSPICPGILAMDATRFAITGALFLSACDWQAGIVREIDLERPIPGACGLRAVENAVGVERALMFELPGGNGYEIEYHSGHENGSLQVILGETETSADIKLRLLGLRINRRPSKAEVAEIRRAMDNVYAAVSSTCAQLAPIESVREEAICPLLCRINSK